MNTIIYEIIKKYINKVLEYFSGEEIHSIDEAKRIYRTFTKWLKA